MDSNIIDLSEDYKSWFINLFEKYSKELNNNPLDALLSYYNKCSFIKIIPGKAFIRYSCKLYFTYIHELCVDECFQKQGIASSLVDYIPGKEIFVAAYPDIVGFYINKGFSKFYITPDNQFVILHKLKG